MKNLQMLIRMNKKLIIKIQIIIPNQFNQIYRKILKFIINQRIKINHIPIITIIGPLNHQLILVNIIMDLIKLLNRILDILIMINNNLMINM